MAFLNFTTGYQYTIEMLIIFIEFGLIVVLICMTIILKLFYRAKKKADKIMSQLIESMILRLIYQNKSFNKLKYFIPWRRLHILIPLIEKIDKEHHVDAWTKIRDQIIKNIILPRARAIVSSLDVRQHVLAAEAFCLMPDRDPIDEEPILQLVNSQIPFVSLNGIHAALVYGSEKTIDAVISRFSTQSFLFESSNLSIFKVFFQKNSIFIEKKLKESSDSAIRAVCYKMLTKCQPIKISWDINQDIYSENMELKISAIKFLSHCNREMAIPLLINNLNDKNLEVRLIVIHRLRMLKATESIPYLEEKLKDDALWVRLSAVQALLDFGFEQEKLARHLNIDPNELLIKIPYTENTWW